METVKSKRVIVYKFGGAENLRLIEEVIPEPRADEVCVKLLTAGVSLADILMCESVHPESLFKRTPFSLGWDIVGIVDISNIVSLYITNHCVASKNLLL